MVPWNRQDQYELTGTTVLQSIRELLEALECIEQAFPTKKVGDGPKTTTKSSDSSKRKMVSFDEGFPRNVAKRNIACFVKSMGAHIPPTTLWISRSRIPKEPQRRTSMGRNPMEPLMDLRNLLEEEVAMCSYVLKLTN
jgi:hypothetical protein